MQDSPPSCLWFVAGRCAAGYGADEIDDASAAAAVVALEGPKRRLKTQLNLKTFFLGFCNLKNSTHAGVKK